MPVRIVGDPQQRHVRLRRVVLRRRERKLYADFDNLDSMLKEATTEKGVEPADATGMDGSLGRPNDDLSADREEG